MSRRAVLWVAFALVHLGVAVLGFVHAEPADGRRLPRLRAVVDVRRSTGTAIVGITETWVYPQLALVPMILAQGFEWIAGYEVAWAILVTALRRPRVRAARRTRPLRRAMDRRRGSGSPSSRCSGRSACTGSTPSPCPLALAGCLWLVGRPVARLGPARGRDVDQGLARSAARGRGHRGAPAARRPRRSARRQRRDARGAVFAAGGGAHAFGFVADQTDRGLQLEAPVSMFYLWRAVAGIPGSFIYYDRDLLTFQVAGPAGRRGDRRHDAAADRGRRSASRRSVRTRRGAVRASLRLFPPLALSLVLALIVVQQGGLAAVPDVAHRAPGGRARDRSPPLVGSGGAGARRSPCSPSSVYPLMYWRLLDADAVRRGSAHGAQRCSSSSCWSGRSCVLARVPRRARRRCLPTVARS